MGLKMNEAQRRKRNFRARKVWKLFKLRKKKECGGIDKITLHKLSKQFELHHEDLREENYTVLKEERFRPLNSDTHDCVHFLYCYYKKDPFILDRLRTILDLMVKYNED